MLKSDFISPLVELNSWVETLRTKALYSRPAKEEKCVVYSKLYLICTFNKLMHELKLRTQNLRFSEFHKVY